jgi:8-oxo-dGTP pyrophosphatase MutT (NUDIX family)
LGTSRQVQLRDDVILLADGTEASYSVVTNPDSAFVVPYFDNGDTMLVRQWRHAWDASSWEVPAGTFDGDEDPLECARRELEEEAGLIAGRLTSLGVVHGAAFLTGRAHLYLGQDLSEATRHPEAYEQDMEVRRLPFRDALEAALDGGIAHSGSVTALCRAARTLKLL